ncbi:7,8-dihydropterin-6-yl-methyl-4-(beta-D-ribofuranosyl)aminobenzene 5'-phosphate synthase [Anaerobacterium chartisolvens]|uniref:7, 8-dihydropterin-6-yl-methyl-4-(Beta-D-ribofuranosyl)aminobenzene 5'-phosphate synthase n=1 Tax=Anaerobacterium chartisolvens TaxID=1297424 RepID=A0A369B768_9FIRM|nr:MBL fold metallo-hydrolase [Anaerobacterium chartisolvens]RCX16377.1 7,8-dihydropterin-6-yl-methyl-4-(beta-D-ribofuranosyl)aminobenzene 5'-phosphate synthase [Anaerobacterium chartisolvens]
MRLTVLVDNNTYIDQYYYGEPAVSYYIEDGNEKILFDTGYSDVFIRNARALHIDLNALSKIVLSHGHNDHTGGLKYFIKQYGMSRVELIVHPDALRQKIFDKESIGCDLCKEEIASIKNLLLSTTPVSVSENIVFLGEIPSVHAFEAREAIGRQKAGDVFIEDYVLDDSALVYNGANGLFIITGCSHSGICNIIEYAKKIFPGHNVMGVIGGFHLFDVNSRLNTTIKYLKDTDVRDLYPCHCVSFNVKAEIARYMHVHEVGVGMTIDI